MTNYGDRVPATGEPSKDAVRSTIVAYIRSVPFIIALAAFTLSAIMAALAMPRLFSPSAGVMITDQLYQSGILDSSAVRTWTVIYKAVTVVCLLLSTAVSAGLWLTFGGCLRGKLSKGTRLGMEIISVSQRCVIYAVYALCALAAPLFIYRAVTYVISCLSENLVAYLIMAMVLFEGMMVVIFALMVKLILHHARSIWDTTAAVSYTVSAFRYSANSIPAGVATTLRVMGIICGFVACLMLPALPEAMAFGMSALGHFAAAYTIKRYRHAAEMMRYDHARNAEGDAVRAHLAAGREDRY